METDSLRELQLFEKKILDDVCDVCRENSIRCYLICGTLLGAARHNGFIPWDDDVDVAMPYEDYTRFIESFSKEHSDAYFVQTYDTDIHWYRSYARVRANNTTMMKPNYKTVDFHQGIYIDIFPVLQCETEKERARYVKKIKFANLLQMDHFARENKVYKAKHRRQLILLAPLYCLPVSMRQKWHGRIMTKLGAKKGKYYYNVGIKIGKCRPAEHFTLPADQVLFEGRLYDAPHNHKEYLTGLYGDYMTPPPLEKRIGHDPSILVDYSKSYKEYQK